MSALARFAMRGWLEAAIIASLAFAAQGLFVGIEVIGGAIIGLVLLRHGERQALIVGSWALIPILAWLVVVDTVPFLFRAFGLWLLFSVVVLTSVLRMTTSWSLLLIVHLGISIAVALLIQFAGQTSIEQMQTLLADVFVQAKVDAPEQLISTYIGLWIALFYGLMPVVSVMVARWMQASLYHPSGFQTEFHRLRMPRVWVLGLGSSIVLLLLSGSDFITLIMLMIIPLSLIGIAIVHHEVERRKLGMEWLVLFYVLMVLLNWFVISLVVALAIIDSLVDYRKLNAK